MVTAAMNWKMLAPWKKTYDKPRQHIKKQRHYFTDKGPYSQSQGFSSSHVWIWELFHKEGWVLKKWYFRIVVLEKTVESPLDCTEIKPVYPKGSQPGICIGRTDTESEAPISWPPDVKRQLIGKSPNAWRDWRQKEKRAPEDEMVIDSTDLNLSKLWEIVEDREAWHAAWGHKESGTD